MHDVEMIPNPRTLEKNTFCLKIVSKETFWALQNEETKAALDDKILFRWLKTSFVVFPDSSNSLIAKNY